MNAFTDIHSHFLYGVDDGARTKQDMEAMLDSAYKDNIRRLVATPHVTPGIKPFSVELFQSRLDEAREYCDEKGYDMKLHLGAENLFTPTMEGFLERNELITLGDSRYVLVEFIPKAELSEIWDAVEILDANGYIPVLAHIERYKNFSFREAKKMQAEYQVVFQMNCTTVIEDKGFLTKRRIEKFLKAELISCLACDAHDCRRRPYKMSHAYEAVKAAYGVRYADALTGNLKISSYAEAVT